MITEIKQGQIFLLVGKQVQLEYEDNQEKELSKDTQEYPICFVRLPDNSFYLVKIELNKDKTRADSYSFFEYIGEREGNAPLTRNDLIEFLRVKKDSLIITDKFVFDEVNNKHNANKKNLTPKLVFAINKDY